MGSNRRIFIAGISAAVLFLVSCTREHAFIPGPPRSEELPKTENLRTESNWAPEPPKEVPPGIAPAEGIDFMPDRVMSHGSALMADQIRVMVTGGKRFTVGVYPNCQTSDQCPANEAANRSTWILSPVGFRRFVWTEVVNQQGQPLRMPAMSYLNPNTDSKRMRAGNTLFPLDGKGGRQVLVYGGYSQDVHKEGVMIGNPLIFREISVDSTSHVSTGEWIEPTFLPSLDPASSQSKQPPARGNFGALQDEKGVWYFVGGHQGESLRNSISSYRPGPDSDPGTFYSKLIDCSGSSNYFRTYAPMFLVYNPTTGNHEIHQIGGQDGNTISVNFLNQVNPTISIYRLDTRSNADQIICSNSDFDNSIQLPRPSAVSISGVQVTSAWETTRQPGTLEIPAENLGSSYTGTYQMSGVSVQQGPWAGKILLAGGLHVAKNIGTSGQNGFKAFVSHKGESTSGWIASGYSIYPGSEIYLYDPIARTVQIVGEMETGRFNFQISQIDHPDGIFVFSSGSSEIVDAVKGVGVKPAYLFNSTTRQLKRLETSGIDGLTGLALVQWKDWTITFFGFDVNSLIWTGGRCLVPTAGGDCIPNGAKTQDSNQVFKF